MVYLNGIFLLNLLVNLLLLLAAGRLCGHSVKPARSVSAAFLGGVYAASCLLPGFYFLGNMLWRMVSLSVMSMIAYGLSADSLRRGTAFAVLSFAVGGAVTDAGMVTVLCAAVVLSILCFFISCGGVSGVQYVPVELSYKEKRLNLTALRDTGNLLRDPITGREVLVIGADAAEALTGLTKEQLKKPVESMEALPGLRLIPYRSVGSSGFLLALRLQDVKIGAWSGSSLVALAPEKLSAEGVYQALTGGTV